MIEFNVGFRTQEVPTPGSLEDSLTVTLRNLSGSQTAVLATFDANGALWAPPSPGGLPLPGSQLQWPAISDPTEPPISGQGLAFSVGFPVPAQLLEPTLNIYFDLFDNQNGLMSWGWYNNLQVVAVPEPHFGFLLALALIAGMWKWRL